MSTSEPTGVRGALTSRRVCLYGGSFDPPHLGHTFVSVWALATLDIDELWWLPTYQHAFGKVSAPFATRARLCEAAVKRLANVRVDVIEGEIGGESRTIDTIEVLRQRFPTHEFSLLVGSDVRREMPKWKRWEDLQQYTIHVARRGPKSATGEPVVIPDVSSSSLRIALSTGDLEFAGKVMDRDVLERVVALGVYGLGE